MYILFLSDRVRLICRIDPATGRGAFELVGLRTGALVVAAFLGGDNVSWVFEGNHTLFFSSWPAESQVQDP